MKKTDFKKIKNISLSFVLVVAMIFSFVVPWDFGNVKIAYADEVSNLQGDLNDVNREQEQVKNDLASVAKKITALQAEYDATNARVNATQADINYTSARINEKQKELTEREENLNARLVVMYKNGSIGFVDVLLGSNSITEFVSNIETIQKIYQNDARILDVLQKEYKELEKSKQSLIEKKNQLESEKAELAGQKEKLNSEKAVLSEKEDELKKEADRLTYEILSLIDTSSEYVGGTFLWPCPSSHYITSSFGWRIHPVLKYRKYHTGTDIGASTGSAILAAGSGRVIKSAVYGGYGNCVMIDHGGGIVTLYGHASKLLVSEGQVVAAGEKIALVGMTGTATGPHLHFEVRVNGEYVNPMQYF